MKRTHYTPGASAAHGPWCICGRWPCKPAPMRARQDSNMEPRRGLEGTGIVVWDDQHTEHVARRAAEIGDAKVEALCDAVHAGLAEDEELVDLIEVDVDYFEWMVRGSHLGWQTRPTEARSST